jgi:FixJ family two-component response regulator
MARCGESVAQNPVIIVVDDDGAVRNSLKFSLELEGYTVRTYSDGAELLTGPELPPRACLVMDYNLPGMNGLEAIARLRERHADVPAILITTHPSATVLRYASEAHVPIVEKPFLEDGLLKEIREAVADQADTTAS